MASIRLLKGRIKSARNIAQITKAMELVAASKMKKAQLAALAGKAYAKKIYDMMMELAEKTDISSHPLLSQPKGLSGKRAVIVISSNKGLCGGLNTNLLRFFITSYTDIKKHSYITLGKKGAEFIVRVGGSLQADFSSTIPFLSTVPALIDMVTGQYIRGEIDAVDVVYNEFFSALKQTPVKKQILPLRVEGLGQEYTAVKTDFVIEPSIAEVFDLLVPQYLENQIRDAILQSEASEHSARMVAMRNATDNAVSLIGELTLLYNKARQEKITYEISDMVTARLAVEE